MEITLIDKDTLQRMISYLEDNNIIVNKQDGYHNLVNWNEEIRNFTVNYPLEQLNFMHRCLTDKSIPEKRIPYYQLIFIIGAYLRHNCRGFMELSRLERITCTSIVATVLDVKGIIKRLEKYMAERDKDVIGG